MRRILAISGLALLLFLGACGNRTSAPAAGAQPAAAPAPAADKAAPPVQNTSAPPVTEEPPPNEISELPVGDESFSKRLVRGFYESVGGGYRWTAPAFAVSLDVPQPLDTTYLELDFGMPSELMNVVHDVTITGRINHQEVVKRRYTSTGRFLLSCTVPPDLLKKSPVEVEYELDKKATDPAKNRDIGLNVVSITLRRYEQSTIGRETEARLSRDGYRRLLEQRRLKLPLEKQNEMMKLFHELPIWSHMWFQNVQIEKSPLDLWMFQQIIYEVQPDFVVETGTLMGGSALYWAYTLNGMGLENSRVFTVDIADNTHNAAQSPLWKKYVTFLKGSSTDPAIVSQIAQRVKGHKTMVTLDSDHSMGHVLEELKMYSPLVTKGSYLVVEDTHLDGVPTAPSFGPGPMAATRKFLAEGGSKDFEPDLTREAFVMTFNPGGWLRRK